MLERDFLICSIVKELGSVRGRKRFQKMIYIAKALGYPVEERFSWGNYGVYSSELQWELDSLVNEDAISQNNVGSLQIPEYEYRLREKGERILDHSIRLIAREDEDLGSHMEEDSSPICTIGNFELDALTSFLAYLNKLSVNDLELWSSILYLKETEKDKENLVSFLHYLKPQYTSDDIRKGIKEVEVLLTRQFFQQNR